MTSIDETINHFITPYADALDTFIFYAISIGGVDIPLIVIWLTIAALFFTIYLGFINIRGFRHAIRLVKGDFTKEEDKGEISHFQALTTALSGTVGIGNIGGVAIVISIGGPGACFWLAVAGFLGMSTKFVECIAGVKYRQISADGSVSGGPMYYLEDSMQKIGLPFLAKPMGYFYAIAIVIGCLGIGNMFQSNQAFEQFVFATGGTDSYFADKGWLFGIIIASIVAIVIIGGIKGIAKVTSKMVPFMGILYLISGLIIIALNADKLPSVLTSIFTEAFAPTSVKGGMIGVMLLGIKRAVFSNEAGIGSASIAHAAVKTNEPVTEGFVALLEPFIDTVVICSVTALVILVTVYNPAATSEGVQGISLTASAFEQTAAWTVYPLSIVAILFAFSTLISWSYYGLKGWTYIFGQHLFSTRIFQAIFCCFVALGCMVQLDSVLKFSDAMVFLVALPNVLALFILAPSIKADLSAYLKKIENNK